MADVKLLRPQRLTDNPDGGGLITSVEIVDGEINNLFDDITRIDRVNGDLSLRAMGVVANTANVEVFGGLHIIVKSPPQDPRVDCLLFTSRFAGGWAGERAEAQAFIERYLDASVLTSMIPYDRQLANGRSILVYQRPELPLPTIGEVYCIEREGFNEPEFFRVQDIAHRVETITDAHGDYQARIVTMTITQPLKAQFLGSQPNRYFRPDTGHAMIRSTLVSDAARYKGTVALAEDAPADSTTIRLATVFGQLVPSATQETSVTNAQPPGATVRLPAAEQAEVLMDVVVGAAPSHTLTPARQWMPGAVLRIELALGGFWWEYTQQDDGSWPRTDGTSSSGDTSVTSDNDRIFIADDIGGGANREITLTGVPAVVASRSGMTAHTPITVGNRGTVYNITLRPRPNPGTLSCSFCALGRWYTLTDDGTGLMVGPDGSGTGLYVPATGTADMTLGAMPDVGSSIIWSWGTDSETEILTGTLAGVVPEIELTLSDSADPGSITISWPGESGTLTATDDGSGELSGDGTGRVRYGAGKIWLRPDVLPTDNAMFTVEYDKGSVETEIHNPSKVGSTITITTAEPIRPGTLLVTYQQTADGSLFDYTTVQVLTDNGIGELVDAAGQIKAGSVVVYDDGNGQGTITFNPDFTAVTPVLNYGDFQRGLPGRVNDPGSGYFADIAAFGLWPESFGNEISSYSFVNGTATTVQYINDDVGLTTDTEAFPGPPITLDLTPLVSNAILGDSVLFEFGGRTYINRGGALFHSPDPVTGGATSAGTLVPATGMATITSWEAGAAPSFEILSLLSEVRPLPVNTVYGRTQGSPVRPASFSVLAERYRDGAELMATADQNGNIETANLRGRINVNNGVFVLAAGAWVLDSSLSPEDKLEPWYDADNVDEDGYIWRPDELMPGTVRYNCVIQTQLPQDASIIGVNPVRLPQDGRVQIIRPGDTLVFHDTQVASLATPVADATVSLSRDNLATLEVRDSTGARLIEGEEGHYTANLVTGELTWADPLDLDEFTGPFSEVNTVEDMALCNDAQITGHISINTPLVHSYTAANSWCSSALVIGDASARVQGMKAINTWLGEWSDDPPGVPPSSGANYNDITYPLELLNRDTITQRWRIQITNAGTGACDVIGEEMGVVLQANINSDIEPINPETGHPWFVLRKEGWGAGWGLNNNLFFMTVAAGDKVWLARPTRSGPATFVDDRVIVEPRWDKD